MLSTNTRNPLLTIIKYVKSAFEGDQNVSAIILMEIATQRSIRFDTLIQDRLLSEQLLLPLTKNLISEALQLTEFFSLKGDTIRLKSNEARQPPNMKEEPTPKKKFKPEQDMGLETEGDNEANVDLDEYKLWISRIGKIFQYFYEAQDFKAHYGNLYLPFSPEAETKILESQKLSFIDLSISNTLFDLRSLEKLTHLNALYEELEQWNGLCPSILDLDKCCDKNINFLIRVLFTEMFLIADEFQLILFAKIGGMGKKTFEEHYFKLGQHTVEGYLNLQARKFLRFKNSCVWDIFETELRNCISVYDIPKATLKVMACRTLLNALHRNPDYVEHYTDSLKAGKCQILFVDQETPAGNLILRAKELLFEVLRRKDSVSQKVLRFYQLLDVTNSNVNELPDDYLDCEVGEENVDEIIEDIHRIFPRVVVSFPFRGIFGCTVFTGNIFIKDSLLKEEEAEGGVAVVRLMFVLMHEIAHLKKFKHLSESNWLLKNPPRYKSICKDLQGFTTGSKLETYAFRGKPNLYNIEPDFAQAFLNSTVTEEQWDQVIRTRKTKPLFPSSVKSSDFEEEDDFESNYGTCGTEKLDFNKRFFEFSFQIKEDCKRD